MSAHRLAESPLDTAETSFRLLCTGPGGLSLDCAALGPGLPRGPIRLAELRVLLTSRHLADDAQDAVWRELVTRARSGGPTWTVAAVGMALPALRKIALALTRDLACGDPIDVDIAIMSGYLRALHHIDVDPPGVRARLCQAARHSGERTRRYISDKANRQPPDESPPPPRPWFHPELVLLDAVADGVLSELDAELISLTRLHHIPLREPRPVCGGRSRQARPTGDHSWIPRAGAEPSISASCSSADAADGPTASARSRRTPDAHSALDQEGGRGTTSGSARISPNHPSVVARRMRASRQHRPQPRRPSGCRPCRAGHAPCWAAAWVLLAAVAAVLLVAAAATGALAAPNALAVPSDLNTVFTNLRNWLIGLLGALATLMLTIGGLRYLAAGGDPGEVQKAKAAWKAAALGYALAVLAPLFVSVLKRIVGG